LLNIDGKMLQLPLWRYISKPLCTFS